MAVSDAPCLFQGATNAGYWVPKLAVLPDVRLGERIWVQVRVFEMPWIWDFDTVPGRRVASKPLSLVVTNSVMTLVGLESLSLLPESFWSEFQQEHVVVRWTHLGADTYELQSTEDLEATNSWVTFFTTTDWHPGSILSVTNPIVGPQRFYRLRRWP